MKVLRDYFFEKFRWNSFFGPLILTVSLLCSPLFASSGQYLAAIHARDKNDFEIALNNYSYLLKNGIVEPSIIREGLLFSVLANDFDTAHKLSDIVERHSIELSTSALISLTKFYKNKDFESVQNILSQYKDSLPTYFIVISSGWLEIENGSFKNGVELFSSLSDGSRYLGLFNCAIAHAMVGEFQNALIYVKQLEGQKLKFDETQIQALVQIYSENNLNDEAIRLIESQGQHLNFKIFEEVLLDLEGGKKYNFRAFQTSADALSNVLYSMGNTNKGISENKVASGFYIQLAGFLSSKKDFYNLRLAEIFSDMRVLDYSASKFDEVNRESTFYLRAQLGLADTFVRSGQANAGKKILERLLNDGFEEFIVFDSLADISRANGDFNTAIFYYNLALENIGDEALQGKWSTLFVRAISYDQSGNWEKAKADLELALTLSADHPEVLNYYGYSLIERNENLKKALEMIKSAVAQRPESGYIIDSLAWGLFRLGQYEEAIAPMERAVQLEPHDPIVNDHLGDVLWMVGRKREAAFQWQRALIFGPTEENKKKINAKLKFGIIE